MLVACFIRARRLDPGPGRRRTDGAVSFRRGKSGAGRAGPPSQWDGGRPGVAMRSFTPGRRAVRGRPSGSATGHVAWSGRNGVGQRPPCCGASPASSPCRGHPRPRTHRSPTCRRPSASTATATLDHGPGAAHLVLVAGGAGCGQALAGRRRPTRRRRPSAPAWPSPTPSSGGEVDGYQHEARWDACTASVLGQPWRSPASGHWPSSPAVSASDSCSRCCSPPTTGSSCSAGRTTSSTSRPSAGSRTRSTPRPGRSQQHSSPTDRALLDAAATGSSPRGPRVLGPAGPWSTYDGPAGSATPPRRRRAPLEGGAPPVLQLREMKRWASLNDGNARKGRRGREPVAALGGRRAAAPAPPERTVRMRLDGAEGGKVALRVEVGDRGLTRALRPRGAPGRPRRGPGANGTGKSHFLRLLSGDDVEHEGAWRFGARTTPGSSTRPTTSRPSATAPCSRCCGTRRSTSSPPAPWPAISAEAAERPVATLSGGQKAPCRSSHLELRA